MWAVCSGKRVIKMDEKNNQVDLEYYDLKGETHHIYMAPGNVQWICNIPVSYTHLFRTNILYHLWGERSRKLGIFAPFLYSIKILQLGHKTDGS